jgi:hypothetical protein
MQSACHGWVPGGTSVRDSSERDQFPWRKAVEQVSANRTLQDAFHHGNRRMNALSVATIRLGSG